VSETGYRQDIPNSLDREAERAEGVARGLGVNQWPERADLNDLAARLRDFAAELRRREKPAQPPKFTDALDALQALRAAGGDGWDKIEDPEAFLGRKSSQ
jgi:predicted dehydrogenase